jgi:glycosyltransferase involved in cell wall biosynthesis
MKKEARILYIYDPENESSRVYAESLRKTMAGWDVSISVLRLSRMLFDIRKYHLAHLFFPAGSKSPSLLKKAAGGTKIVHSVLSFPAKPEEYRNLSAADRLIVWCNSDRELLLQNLPGASIDVIPPCVSLPDVNLLQSSSESRRYFEVGERTMVIALNDITHKQAFDSYLYVIREYNRNGGFKLIIPKYRSDKETQTWRQRLQIQINQENLHTTTLLDTETDIHSLLDSADFVLYIRKDRDEQFDFPLTMVEALLIGKPVLCFDVPPFNESLKGLRRQWICSNIEEVVRESKDIRKDFANLEEISTDIARYSRSRFAADKSGAWHRSLYESILNNKGAQVL